MAELVIESNKVTLKGEIASGFTYSHEIYGEKFYLMDLEIKRLSEHSDIIPVMVSERLIDIEQNYTGTRAKVEGQFRSYNSREEGKNKLQLSLKQALSALGFKGGTRRETELNQWVACEKEQLAAVMLEHGIEWEKKGTHEKHLSVLDFEKKERAKEVAELEAKKAELQEENATFQEINEDLHEQLLQVDDEIHSLQEDLQESRQEAEKAQKQADKYQKRMNELAPMVKNMEKLAADFSADPEQTLPEAAVMESAKSYREKKAKPLIKKIVQVMRFVYSAYLDISNKFTKLQAAYNRERSGNERLTNRLEEVLDENRELRIVAADFGRIKAVVGSEQVNAVINRAKQQEQIEAEQKRAARRKHNREAL